MPFDELKTRYVSLQEGMLEIDIISHLAANYDEGTPIIQYKIKKGEQHKFQLSTRY